MANRTTAAEVQEIITTTLSDPEIETWIGVANTVVTANVTCGLSDVVLEEIERQLTAHFISLLPSGSGGTNLPIKKERLAEAEVTYADIFSGGGLSSTSYGQTALMLDTCGGLANMSKKAIKMTAITSFE